jgi:hypothetical protein
VAGGGGASKSHTQMAPDPLSGPFLDVHSCSFPHGAAPDATAALLFTLRPWVITPPPPRVHTPNTTHPPHRHAPQLHRDEGHAHQLVDVVKLK